MRRSLFFFVTTIVTTIVACSSDSADKDPSGATSGSGGGSATSTAAAGGTDSSAATDSSSASASGASGSGGLVTSSTGGAGTGGSSSPDGSATGSTGSGGTGGDSGDAMATTPDARPEVQQACSMFAATLCGKIRDCSAFALGALYGDAATCERRLMLSCIPNLAAPGSSAAPATTAGCAEALAALSCTTFLAGDLGPACKIDPGTLAIGAACGDDAQCASTFCARAPDATCGVCAATTKVNDPCVRSSCSAGTVCPAGQTTCIAPTPGKIDDACDVQEQCDLAHGVGCNTTSGKCFALTLASAQGTCGANSVFATSYAVCPASGTCSALLAGRCSATAGDGQSCSTSDTGAHCLPPARCVGGKCVVPDPSLCH